MIWQAVHGGPAHGPDPRTPLQGPWRQGSPAVMRAVPTHHRIASRSWNSRDPSSPLVRMFVVLHAAVAARADVFGSALWNSARPTALHCKEGAGSGLPCHHLLFGPCGAPTSAHGQCTQLCTVLRRQPTGCRGWGLQTQGRLPWPPSRAGGSQGATTHPSGGPPSAPRSGARNTRSSGPGFHHMILQACRKRGPGRQTRRPLQEQPRCKGDPCPSLAHLGRPDLCRQGSQVPGFHPISDC